MNKFEYLPGAISFATALYIALLVCFVLLYRTSCCIRTPCVLDNKSTSCGSFFKSKSFEYVFHNSTFTGKIGTYLLFFWRATFFCYFFGIAFLRSYIINANDAIYFTFWNINLITLYYFLAMIASGIGICHDPIAPNHYKHYWTPAVTRFGYVVQILYALSVPSSWFITVIAYTLLDPRFVFQNVNVHFLTSISFLFEIIFNRLSPRIEHIILYLTWIYCYLLFIWPLVTTGGIPNWPYTFLDTDTKRIYVWYASLNFISLGFYIVFWCIIWIKDWMLEFCCHIPNTINRVEHGSSNNIRPSSSNTIYIPTPPAVFSTATPVPTATPIPTAPPYATNTNDQSTYKPSPMLPSFPLPRRSKTYTVTTNKKKGRTHSSIFAEDEANL